MVSIILYSQNQTSMASIVKTLQDHLNELTQAYKALLAFALSPCCQTVLIRQCDLRGLIREYLETQKVRDWNTLYQQNTTSLMCNGCNQEVDTILAEVATILT